MTQRLIIVSLLLCIACKDKDVAQSASEPEAKPQASQSNATEAPSKEKVAEPQKEVKAPVIPSRIKAPGLPDVPKDNLLLVIHKANTNCQGQGTACTARDALAAKIVAEVDTVTELLKTGTDQQKQALRQALLVTHHPVTDQLLIDGIIGSNGNLDKAVISATRTRRSAMAIDPLKKHLKKAVGTDIVLAIDTLSYLGSPRAVELLTPLLKSERLKPYQGAVCQALARLMAKDSMGQVSAIATRTGATESQVIGCGGAEAAFRTLAGGSPITLNLDGKQRRIAKIMLHQKKSDPLALAMTVSTDPKSSCKAPGSAGVQLRVPLDRDAEAIVGSGLIPSLSIGGKDLGSSGAFLLRFTKLELKTGASARGTIHFSHTQKDESRTILSGHFVAMYCGVSE
ncbi:MAG TPA: hypothetical protein EYN66_21590 [Myxococcales bacterium]|nr:hypothetical protein [Myxococcales bacterium]